MTMRASHVSLAGRIWGIFPGVAEVGRERLDPIKAENACVPYNMIRLLLRFTEGQLSVHARRDLKGPVEKLSSTGVTAGVPLQLTGRGGIHKIRPTPEGMGQMAVWARSAWIPYWDCD